jgi:hypothetical protein
MNDEKDIIELYEFILKSLEGTISRQEFSRLKKRLAEEPGAAKHYVDFMTTYAAMYQPGGACAFVLSPDANGEARFDDMLWHALAETEKVAVGVDVEKPGAEEHSTPESEFGQRRGIIQRRRKVSRLSLYAAIISTATLVVMMAYVIVNPRVTPAVAAVTDVMDAKWAEGYQIPPDDTELHPGRMSLIKGFAEITFDGGARVVVQGPAEVELETISQMFLHKGKLWSYVPESALGFTVRTPGATIVDYGTEFGVAVRDDGATQAYVFAGRVDLRTGSNPRVFEKAQRLTAGEGGAVDKAGNLSTQKIPAIGFARGMEQVRVGRALLGRNLVVNGDFEDDRGVVFNSVEESVQNIEISGWDDNVEATVLTYLDNAGNGYPDPHKNVVPNGCGKNFYVGVGSCGISQEIDVALLSPLVDSGQVRYDFSAWLGGFANHPDSAELILVFLNEDQEEIKTARLEQITVAQRRAETGFVRRKTDGVVPNGTERIRIELNSYQRVGLADSYVDNISLILSYN